MKELKTFVLDSCRVCGEGDFAPGPGDTVYVGYAVLFLIDHLSKSFSKGIPCRCQLCPAGYFKDALGGKT